MRVLEIALKDLRQFSRSLPTLVMSLAAPLVLTAIMGFAFGGIGRGQAPRLQVTTLQVANLDQGLPGSPTNLGGELLETLQDPALSELMHVTTAADEASVRAAVDGREVEVALIIPPGFSAAVASPEGQPAEVTLYHDPTLSTRPVIVASAIQRMLDAFSGTRVAGLLTWEQLTARGAPASVIGSSLVRAAESFARAVRDLPLLTVETVSLSRVKSEGIRTLMGRVNAGMMVFFMFYMAALAAESILHEEEERTLQRLFTLPTRRATVLAGKFLSVVMIVLVQAALLVAASALLFGIRWGDTLGVGLQLLASVVSAGGAGLLLVSLARNTRQAGFLFGGVLAVMGMAGGLFTVGFSNLPKALDTIALLTPHGWAMRGWNVLLRGEDASAVLLPAAVSLVIGLVTFTLGAQIFRRRYA